MSKKIRVLDERKINFQVTDNKLEIYDQKDRLIGERPLPIPVTPDMDVDKIYNLATECGYDINQMITTILEEVVYENMEYDIWFTYENIIFYSPSTKSWVSEPYEGLFELLDESLNNSEDEQKEKKVILEEDTEYEENDEIQENEDNSIIEENNDVTEEDNEFIEEDNKEEAFEGEGELIEEEQGEDNEECIKECNEEEQEHEEEQECDAECDENTSKSIEEYGEQNTETSKSSVEDELVPEPLYPYPQVIQEETNRKDTEEESVTNMQHNETQTNSKPNEDIINGDKLTEWLKSYTATLSNDKIIDGVSAKQLREIVTSIVVNKDKDIFELDEKEILFELISQTPVIFDGITILRAGMFQAYMTKKGAILN